VTTRQSAPMNKVYLVGAGPGDPELITWKGRRILAAADSILYDHLANDALLDLAPPSAERQYVGQNKSAHAVTQEEICPMPIARGRSPQTPAMAVRWATRPDQQTLVGTLATLPGMIERSGLKPPATIIVGEVVRLREKLNWFERLPLFGQRIVITRAQEQAGSL